MDAAKEIPKLEIDLNILLREYELYLNGANKTEPVMLLSRVQKQIAALSRAPLLNTSQRFKLNSLTSRFHTNKIRWEKILRKRDETVDADAASPPPPAEK